MGYKNTCELVRSMEEFDRNGTTTTSKYVEISMRDDINTTEAYINSKHISGSTDYLGREKPFFNIVNSAVNIYYRATDIDRKHILIRATREADEIKAFLATILLQEWMKKENFGQFLNDWGLSLSRHGSTICKFIEKEGKLHATVIDWNNVICDAVDFYSAPVIEKLWLTPAQLRERNYDKDMVKALIKGATIRETIDGDRKDTKSDYIPIYEIHGKLPLSYLTDKEKDEDEYIQQVHIVSFLTKNDGTDGYDDYTLYRGRESKNPYLLTHLIKKDGLTYSGGAVKNLFEAQWMVNHTEKLIKDQLELASKLIFQTSDGAFAGKNAMNNIENGDILTYSPGNPLTLLNSRPDIAAMQSFKADWQNISLQINGISEAMAGQSPMSGTPWRQTQALLQESHSLFELMTENKGLAIIEMMEEFVIPHFKKQLDTSEEISALLDEHQIKEFDSRYVPNEAIRRVNQKKKQTILSGQIYATEEEPVDLQNAEAEIQKSLKGNQRFIKPSDIPSETWKDIMKDLEWELEIDVTGEAKDKQGALATLTTVLQTITQNPMVLQDPNVKMVFGKILNLAGGISPLEITTPKQPVPQPMAGAVGGGLPQMPIK